MKYVPGLMVGQLSGKAGSTVASRNRAGSYFRTRTIPKLVRNAKTTGVRALFTGNSQAYRDLTDGQRAGWASLGAQLTRKNSLGETIRLTGSQAYQSINANLFNTGQSTVPDAPTQVDAVGIQDITITAAVGAPGTTTVVVGATSVTQNLTSTAALYPGANVFFATAGVFRQVDHVVDATHVVLTLPVTSTTAEVVTWTDTPTISIAFDPNPVPAGTWFIVSATGPLSAGVSRPSKGEFRLLDSVSPAATSPLAFGGKFFNVFGLPSVGSKVFISVKPVSAAGIAGTAIVGVAIVS